jgi:hypothetical protein
MMPHVIPLGTWEHGDAGWKTAGINQIDCEHFHAGYTDA